MKITGCSEIALALN